MERLGELRRRSEPSERAWMALALCKEHPHVNFYPTDGFGTMVCQRICARCPVRPDCLDYALEHGEDQGVWGGASERARRRMAKDRRRGVQALF